jgi:murein lipoprotein
MSQSPITITYSLEEILTRLEQKIDSNHKEVNQQLDTLQKDVSDFRTETKVAIESLKGEIKTLDVEVKGINKRLDSQEFINRSIAAGLLLALLTGVIKLFFPNFPNLPH